MFSWLFWLMLVFAITDWAASWRGWGAVRWVTKPGTLILLIAWFVYVGGWHAALIWFGAGLVFSLLGDILLLLPERFFLAGAGAFFLAHVAYIVGFLQPPFNFRWQLILPLALVGGAFLFINWRVRAGLREHGQTAMLAPLMAYSGVLSLMWLAAMTTLLRPDWAGIPAVFASLGASLFFLSDSLLAYSRFVRPLPASDLLVMVTYHLAQIFIASSALVLLA